MSTAPTISLRHYRKAGEVADWLTKQVMSNATALPTIPALSRQFHVSAAVLMRAFRERYGSSIHSYTIALKMKRSMDLLVSTDQPVKVIASMVGYSELSNFSRDFSRVVGLSPSLFRVRQRAV